MLRGMKYLMFQFEDGSKEPVLFSPSRDHSSMKDALPGKIVSGGMARIYEGDSAVYCYGESLTCHVRADAEDAGIIASYLVD